MVVRDEFLRTAEAPVQCVGDVLVKVVRE